MAGPERPARGRPRRVFVSHAGVDTWVARQIERELRVRGVEPFLDEVAIPIGADFDEEIRQSLERADELLVLLTPRAFDRPYIWAELGAAWVRRIRQWVSFGLYLKVTGMLERCYHD